MYLDEMPPELCQGDIIRDLTHLHLKPPLRVLRESTIKGGQQIYEFFDPSEQGLQPKGGYKLSEGEFVSSFCQRALGIVLTHGREIDKDDKHRQVALIRPLSVIPDESNKEKVRNNQIYRFFYLEAVEDMGESYVDFRRICTISPEFIDLDNRVASLNEVGVKALQERLFFYFTRRQFVQGDG